MDVLHQRSSHKFVQVGGGLAATMFRKGNQPDSGSTCGEKKSYLFLKIIVKKIKIIVHHVFGGACVC